MKTLNGKKITEKEYYNRTHPHTWLFKGTIKTNNKIAIYTDDYKINIEYDKKILDKLLNKKNTANTKIKINLDNKENWVWESSSAYGKKHTNQFDTTKKELIIKISDIWSVSTGLHYQFERELKDNPNYIRQERNGEN